MGATIETLKLTAKFIKAGARYHKGKSTKEQFITAIDKALAQHPDALDGTIEHIQSERALAVKSATKEDYFKQSMKA